MAQSLARLQAGQAVIDAGLALLGCRRATLDVIAGGGAPEGAELIETGNDASRFTMQRSRDWQHLLSTRPMTSYASLARSIENNRRRIAEGLTMISVFDRDGTDDGARRLLVDEPDPTGAYYIGLAPVQMRLIDHEQVYVHGTSPERPILSMWFPGAVRAAQHYFAAVLEFAEPCLPGSVAPLQEPRLSPRQEMVLALLAQGMTDETIAASLAVSVRTVRTEVARAMRFYEVDSRFALGFAHGKQAHRAE